MIETNVAKTRSTLIKVELLDMQERPVGSVEGQVISGNITIDGNSILRRVANLSFITTDDNYRILETSNSLSISKKIRISIGERDLDDQSPTKWFSMGVFLLTGFSSSANVSGQTISISAKDKMAMHNGDVSGKVKHGVRVDSEFENESVKKLYETMSKNFDVALEAKDANTEEFNKLSKLVDEMYNEMAGVNYEMESTLVRMKNKLSVAKLLEGIEYRRQMRELRADMALLSTNSGRNKLTIREIVRYAATALAGELPGKVIVADIPDKIKTPVMLPDGRVGFRMIKYVYPEELTLNTGQPVTAIYEACKNALGGNYEYFYDVDGNFVFQEIKNYKYNNIVDVDEISPQEYRVSHDRTPIQIDFSGTDIITSYSNRPDPQNIKNDFHVWGSNGSDTIGYHLVIDDRPYVPDFVKDFALRDQKNLIKNGWDDFEAYGGREGPLHYPNSGTGRGSKSDNTANFERIGDYLRLSHHRSVNYYAHIFDTGEMRAISDYVKNKEYIVLIKINKGKYENVRLHMSGGGNSYREYKDIYENSEDRYLLFEYGEADNNVHPHLNVIGEHDLVVKEWIFITDESKPYVLKTPLGNGLTRIQTWGGKNVIRLRWATGFTPKEGDDVTFATRIKNVGSTTFWFVGTSSSERLTPECDDFLKHTFTGNGSSSASISLRTTNANIGKNLDFIASDPVIVEGSASDINFNLDWREYLVYNRDVGPNVEFIGKISRLDQNPPFNQYNGRPPVALYVDPDGDKWERKFIIYKGGKWHPYDPEPPIGPPSEYYSEIKHIWMPDRFYPDGSRIENRADYSYHFDIIEGSKDLDRFSVKTIGRRGEPIEDKNIRQVYPTKIEDILVYYDEEDLDHTRNKDQAIKVDTPKDFAKYPPAGNVYRDAFTTIKQMLFKHTTYNEQVAITSLPLYEMEVNRRNYIEYDRASIRGLYLSTKISFNFDENSLMNVNFIRVNPIEQ